MWINYSFSIVKIHKIYILEKDLHKNFFFLHDDILNILIPWYPYILYLY